MKYFAALLAVVGMLVMSPAKAEAVANVEANRASALAFYDALIVSKTGADAARRYMAQEFVSHSPTFAKSDADTFLKPADDAAKNPDSPLAQWRVEVLRTIADGNFVTIHARGKAGNKVFHIVDILRFDAQGKIAEHWDVIQDVTDVANPAGAF